MPDHEAIQQLTDSLTQAFNAVLPEIDPELPQDAQDAMADALDSIRSNNEMISNVLATSLNTFLGSARVMTRISYNNIKSLIENHIHAIVNLRREDILAAEQSDGSSGGVPIYLPVPLNVEFTYDPAGPFTHIYTNNAIQ